jgi:hypothetical protein
MAKKAPNRILSINAGPETFTSQLPDGVHGSLELLEEMTVDNVLDVTVDNDDSYEGNIDGEWTVFFHNGDEIRFDGYYGDRDLLSYDSLKAKAKTKALNWFKERLAEAVEYAKE